MINTFKNKNGTFITSEKSIALRDVRVSFPALFKKPIIDNIEQDKYGATFLIAKDNKTLLATLKKAIAAIQKESDISVPQENLCLKNGDLTNRDENKGYYVLAAKNKLQPRVLDGNKQAVKEDDNKIYAGCYVNASITLTLFKGGLGTFLSARLNGVQFLKDGESFEGSASVNEDDFDTLNDVSIEIIEEDFLTMY